jgi:hypothetical protein
MKGANLENLPIAGSSAPADPAWLSVKEIVDGARARGVEVTERQLERWREKKLLPPGAQEFEVPGHGGAYKFPPITIDVAVAIRKLQLEKDDLDWIGRQLWWRGFSVDESCWRPMLLEMAKSYDRTLRLIRARVVGERDDDDDMSREDTLADRVAQKFSPTSNAANILASRIVGRVPLGELPSILRLILETASGLDPEFESGSTPADERLLIRAMDLSTVRTDLSGETVYQDDRLAGKDMGLRQAFRPMLGDIAAAIRHGTLLDAANASRVELECARDDLTRIMEFAPVLYGATKWIYGEKALGLRFASWISRKTPEPLQRLYLLLWVLMRRVDAQIISSDEILSLHSMAMSIAKDFQKLENLSQNYGQRIEFLKPRYLKEVFADEALFSEFILNLKTFQIK